MRMHQETSKVLYIDQLKSWFEGSSDIVIKKRTYREKPSAFSLEFLYCSNLVDMKFINEVIFPSIHTVVEKEDNLNIDQLRNLIEVSSLKDRKNVKTEVEQKLFSGELIIFSHELNELFFIPASGIPKRSPEESSLEPSVKGPRDGFVENISDNLALIRQRLKTSSLKSIEYTIGERSRTKLILLYIDDIMNPSILESVKKRLESIKIDIVVSSYEIEEHLYDNVFSIFPLIDYIGRPDFAVQSLNQGRFVVLVEGNPTCLIGPTNFNQILYSPEDVNESFFYMPIEEYNRFISKYYQAVGSYLIPSIDIKKGKFLNNKKPINIVTLTGGYVISQQKYKGWLNKQDLVGLKWFSQHAPNIPLSLFKESVSVIIKNPEGSIKVLSGRNPSYQLNVKTHVAIVDNEENLSVNKMEKELSQQIKNQIIKTLNRSDEMNADILNISEKPYRYQNKKWDKNTINNFKKDLIKDIKVKIIIDETINYKR